MYEVIKNVDYIACSVSHFIPIDDSIGRWQDTNPRQRNYNKAKIFDCGMIVQWHERNQKMKTSIILSGETLAKLRDMKFKDFDIIHWLSKMKDCKFSRIDICVTSRKIDGTMHGMLPHAIHYFAMNGLCNTKLKVDNPVANNELLVETAYIGSRKSRNRIFRAYDKGLELGLEANKIIRYELETRKNATHIAREIEINKTDIVSIIRRYVDFPTIEVWMQIMSSEVAENWRIDEYESVAEKNKKRWQWLFDSVAPAMAKALFDDSVPVEDNKNADIFAAKVAAIYNQLVDKSST